MTIRAVDIHTHTFPAKIAAHALEVLSNNSHTRPFTDGTTTALKASMAEAGITCSVIQPVATKPGQVTAINDAAIMTNSEGSSTGIYSFGAIHPGFEDFSHELGRLYDSGIRGIKIHPVYQGVPADNARCVEILRIAGELGLVVMIHAGWDIGFPGDDSAMPERISRALDMAGNVRVILAHMGGWKCWDEALRLFTGREGVYVDSAFSLGEFVPNGDGYYSGGDDCMMLGADEFVGMVRAFGSERVLFGTDSPWASQSESVKAFLSLPLTDEEKSAMLYNNASKILFRE